MGDDHGRHPDPGGPPSHGRCSAGSSVLTPPTGLSVVPDEAVVVGTPEPVRLAVRSVSAVTPCRCGHDPDAHRHWRRGSDCGQCGIGECTAYRARAGVLRRLLQGVGLAP